MICIGNISTGTAGGDLAASSAAASQGDCEQYRIGKRLNSAACFGNLLASDGGHATISADTAPPQLEASAMAIAPRRSTGGRSRPDISRWPADG
jgi:hypothetical protein